MPFLRLFLICSFFSISMSLNSDDRFRQADYEPRTHEEVYFSNEYLSEKVLTEEDLEYQEYQFINNESELSSGSNSLIQWKSFNKWSCYSSDVAEFSCTSGYKNVEIPTIHINLGYEYRDFDFDNELGDQEESCDVTISKWKILLEEKNEFCIYAAYLQELNYENKEKPHSLWLASDFKTESGVWKLHPNEDE